MADVGGNPLWNDIKNGNAEVDLLGPDYSYADTITGPTSLGVGSSGTFGQLGTNANAISYYVQALITGNPPLGNQFFVNTGGMCVSPDGSLQPRYNYINNMASGAAALPSSISELGSDFNGLIPGVADDIEGLNPLHMFAALAADSNPSCVCMSCPVTGAGKQSKFVNKELAPDLAGSQCQQVDSTQCMPPPESFANQHDLVSAIPTIIAALGVLYFIFSGRK
jgi:hypothetical protein